MSQLEQIEALLLEKEMARAIPVTPRTLRSWRNLGLIPYIKIRRTILYNPASVLQALKRLEREAITK